MIEDQLSSKVYKRAEKFLVWNTLMLVSHSVVRPNWINESDEFWYLKDSLKGNEFLIFDPASNLSYPAFNQQKFAISLSKFLNKPISSSFLPIKSIQFSDEKKQILFAYNRLKYICDLDTYEIRKLEEPSKDKPEELISPDEKWVLFNKEHDLYLRSIITNETFRLTFDGEKYYEYAISPECNTHTISDRLGKKPLRPIALWSPDSRKIVTIKIDQRRVKDLHLLQTVPSDGSSRPILHSYKYALPHDKEIPMGEIVILDVEKKSKITAKHDLFPISYWSFIEYNWMWWSKSSDFVFFVFVQRFHKMVKFYEINSRTADMKIILEVMLKEKESSISL